jgi:hypothetical protein
MRILNIVFNAEIKYQQYAKLRKFRHKNFRSNFDPGKTHKGKTSERGLFIIIELLRNLFYNSLIFNKNTNLSQKIYARLLLEEVLENAAPRFLSQKSVQLYGCLQQLMLYGTPKKSCLFFVFVVPSFLCIKCPSKIVPRLEMRAVRTFVLLLLYGLSNPYCTASTKLLFPFLEIFDRNLLYDPQEIRTVRPSHSAIPSSISVLLGCLGNRALTLQMLSSQARPLSLALSTRR